MDQRIGLTTAAPLPRVTENAYKTFTVGSSHFVRSEIDQLEFEE